MRKTLIFRRMKLISLYLAVLDHKYEFPIFLGKFFQAMDLMTKAKNPDNLLVTLRDR